MMNLTKGMILPTLSMAPLVKLFLQPIEVV